jgi:hypothetical protein
VKQLWCFTEMKTWLTIGVITAIVVYAAGDAEPLPCWSRRVTVGREW